MASSLFVLDVQEKETNEAQAPSLPQMRPGTSGFPEHKKRSKFSAFKQRRQGPQCENEKPKVFLSSSGQPLSPPSRDPSPRAAAPSGGSLRTNEKSSIDRENSQRLASMSPREIEEARQELFSGLDPSILEMLLKRADINDGANTLPLDDQTQPAPEPSSSSGRTPTDPARKVRFADTSMETQSSTPPETSSTQPSTLSADDPDTQDRDSISEKPTTDSETTISTNPDDDSAPAKPPAEHIITPTPTTPPADAAHSHPSHHWPRAPQPADLDPSDPNFLQSLHEKYFPSLPADPSKLAWMAPIPTPNSAADRDSPYYPGQDSLPISALRFDFRGALLPPRIARAVPTTKGLHHHGEAPEAAGYTVRELARLARSAVPGQRCVAYQTLGRILYRLGRGEFGGVAHDDVSMGIWREMEEGAVMRSLLVEAGTEEGRGHRSARAFATEAIWLYEKGGWREKVRKA
ncbi:RPAP1-like protein [Astrocystis sublimbata]|nr:RPAP1-like protein [Astrocystis sublimbata]